MEGTVIRIKDTVYFNLGDITVKFKVKKETVMDGLSTYLDKHPPNPTRGRATGFRSPRLNWHIVNLFYIGDPYP